MSCILINGEEDIFNWSESATTTSSFSLSKNAGLKDKKQTSFLHDWG